MRRHRDLLPDHSSVLAFWCTALPVWCLCAVAGLLLVCAEPAHAAGRGRAADGDRAWPVGGADGAGRPVVVRGWEPPPTPYAAGHRGADLAAHPGQPVRAAGRGKVSFAGSVGGRRTMAIELSGTGSPPLRVTYEPVRAAVRKGDPVMAGQVVGRVDEGPFHCVPGCLHWGLLKGDRYLDPLSLLPPGVLRGGPSRLLPVHGVPELGAGGSVGASSAAGSAGSVSAAVLLAAAAVWARSRLGSGHAVARLAAPAAAALRGRWLSRGRRAGPSTPRLR
jgi:hypothetical protein